MSRQPEIYSAVHWDPNANKWEVGEHNEPKVPKLETPRSNPLIDENKKLSQELEYSKISLENYRESLKFEREERERIQATYIEMLSNKRRKASQFFLWFVVIPL